MSESMRTKFLLARQWLVFRRLERAGIQPRGVMTIR
jgi:hypothetical protein